MQLKPNQYIKIKDIDHLKRLCEENNKYLSIDALDKVKNGDYVYLFNNGDEILFGGKYIDMKEEGYTEVLDEPQENNTSKNNLIKELLERKAEENNRIDLNAYALGLEDMYKAMKILLDNL